MTTQRTASLAEAFGYIVLLSVAAAAFSKSDCQGAVRVDFRSSPKYACINTIGNEPRPKAVSRGLNRWGKQRYNVVLEYGDVFRCGIRDVTEPPEVILERALSNSIR